MERLKILMFMYIMLFALPYYHFGLLGYEVELGIAQNAVGLSAQDALDGQGFLDYEKQREESDRRLLKFWESSAKSEPLFAEWETVEHPQLGTVEVGGFLEHRHNPMLCILEPIAAGSTGFIVDHARRHPQVELASLSVTPVGDGTFQVCAEVVNSGQLPSPGPGPGCSYPSLFPPGPGVVMVDRCPKYQIRILKTSATMRQVHTTSLNWHVHNSRSGL